MNEAQLIESLKEIIKPYVQDEEAFAQLSPESNFIKDLKINSANLVDIVLDVEEAYQIEIDNESMERMQTVGAAMDIIREKVSD
ncbi:MULTISPECIES: acyl carrier protein [Siphonobacter]|uniref:Acyl carrier protein n=1 Tax=Siphonobacter curvatus TaxID=2094562 RepID=A0A2S7II04_9BACT|nr:MULTISPECIES: phosphopantetheine-binding protein [Siphonobacter]PMD91660.1 acyl carrier protein [Siphonobacter sp. BAB-5405]PQA55710.1 acyl carrier protein [Siphonobacter curvatus]